MIRIDYTIISGAFPITVELVGSGKPSNVHNIPEAGYFDNVVEGDYEITFTDSDNCTASEQLQWCDCPAGYIQTGTNCVKYDEIEATYSATTYTILKKSSDAAYSVYGLLIFDSWNYDGTGTFEWINDSNAYWRNVPYPSFTGVMNRTSVWGSTTSNFQDIGFSFCINIATTKTYYVGFGCDNWGKIKLNGQFILEQDLTAIKSMFASLGMSGYNDDGATFKYWYIYPLMLTAGQNIIEVFGHNVISVAAVGIQIYNATKQDIIDATDINPLGDKILFTSESLVGETLQYEYSVGGGYHGYSCPEGYALDTCGEVVKCVKKEDLSCGEEPATTTTTTTTIEPTTTTTSTTTTIIDEVKFIVQFHEHECTKLNNDITTSTSTSTSTTSSTSTSTSTTTTQQVYTACADFNPYFET